MNHLLTNTIRCKRLFLVGVLLVTVLLCRPSLSQNRDQRSTQPNPSQKVVPDKQDEERHQRAQAIIEGILADAKTIQNPVTQIRIRMLAADAYWNLQPEKAREILSDEFPKIRLIAVPKNEDEFGKIWSRMNERKTETYKGTTVEQVKARLRREMLAIVSAHDPALARALLEGEKKEKKYGPGEETDEVLETAGELAQTDPNAAARIIKDLARNRV